MLTGMVDVLALLDIERHELPGCSMRGEVLAFPGRSRPRYERLTRDNRPS